jgi:phage N-6-adenine-methyltransferase
MVTKHDPSFFQRNAALFSFKSSEYQTPKWLYDQLNREFHFELDPCTTADNPLGTKYFCYKQEGLEDGLIIPWNVSTYVNPPYGKEIDKWVKKAYDDSKKYGRPIVMLLPVRTDTKWFHAYIYRKPNVEIRFIRGRLRFGGASQINTAPFPSMVVVFR